MTFPNRYALCCIPDPKTATKEFFVATNITKLKIILFLNRWRKNFGPIYEKLPLSSQIMGFRSGIRKKPFLDPTPRWIWWVLKFLLVVFRIRSFFAIQIHPTVFFLLRSGSGSFFQSLSTTGTTNKTQLFKKYVFLIMQLNKPRFQPSWKT
jgi:hypothetical protein